MSVIQERAKCWADVKAAIGYNEDDTLIGFIERENFFSALRAEAIKRNIIWPQIYIWAATLESAQAKAAAQKAEPAPEPVRKPKRVIKLRKSSK